ncbi:MAG TPA: amidohydrolase family protein [Candidatus Angelobacter sp.]|nr:amidohydrolase family protein [Candidatus Angelobacter sp.]
MIQEALLAAWEHVGAIDHHGHLLRRWPFNLTAVELRSAFSEALDPAIAEHHVIHTAVYQDAIRRIAIELGCEPNEDGVLELRNKTEGATYARDLLQRTTTEVMLVDTGFASAELLTLEEQQTALGMPQREIVRLETLAEKLIGSADNVAAWFGEVRAALQISVERGAVGVKTICAYRASLKLRTPDQDELERAFRNLKREASTGAPVRLSGDALCHALLLDAARACGELDVPLQIHCGFGDPDEDLAETSPLGLRPLFIDPTLAGLRIALLHCYPYHRDAAYLCSVFPNVYMDLSLTIPFAGLDGFRAMKETLGLCPTSKLLYATDATRYPEVYFVAARLHREALAEALGEFVDRGIMRSRDAESAGRLVLAENARRLYVLNR